MAASGQGGLCERLAKSVARRVNVRGVGRALRIAYPPGPTSPRFVRGIREREDGLLMDVDSREVIDWCVVFYGEYEPHMGVLFERTVGAGDVAIDIGANVGAHTLTMGRLVGPAGRVLAVEPNPAVLRRLQRNIELNGLHQVTVIPHAAGACPGRLQLRVPAADSREWANPGLASLVALETPHTVVGVDVTPLDDVVHAAQLDRVSLIKIDVQGYERHVLQGGKETLRMFQPVVVFEFEPWAWSRASAAYEDVRHLLAGLSYGLFRLWEVAGGGIGLVPLRAEPGDHAEIVAVPADWTKPHVLRNLMTFAAQ